MIGSRNLHAPTVGPELGRGDPSWGIGSPLYPTDGGEQVNLGSQQPLPQMVPTGQSRCFLQRRSATQPAPPRRQMPPPPGFCAQKDPSGHPVPPKTCPLRQMSGSVHVSVQVRWTQTCPVGQLRLRRQVVEMALASCPPQPSRGPSAPATSPPSTRRRGRRVHALVIASNC